MVLVIRRADDDQLNMLRANPERVMAFVVEDDYAYEAGEAVDFDKAWHAIHFLFTGSVDEVDAPLSLLRKDYEPLGEDTGYGSAQVISAANMKEFDRALKGLSDEALQQRYDPGALSRADVYLGETLAEEGQESWEYVAQGLPALRKLSDRCAATNSALIAVIV